MSSFSGGRGGGRWSSSNGSSGGRFSQQGRGGGGGGGPFSKGRGGRSFHPSSTPYSEGGNPSSQQQQQQQAPPPRLKPCSYFVSSGSCTNNPCHFAHVIKLHAAIESSSALVTTPPSLPTKKGAIARAPISSVALYPNPTISALQIFASSHDGTWRVYNASRSFAKELEHTMSSTPSAQQQQQQQQQQHKIGTLCISSSVLFCGFEGVHVQLPHVVTGMIFAWNLHSPQDPPLEFHMGPHIPFAHSSCISCLIPLGSDVCISGSTDGTIRTWSYTLSTPSSPTGASSKCTTTLCGHVGEITGLVVAANNILWSSSTDRTIRLWDLSSSQCVYVIYNPESSGHTDAITCLLSYHSPIHGSFIFSGSLDGNIKVWNPNTGECVATVNHGVGVTCMDCVEDLKGNGLVIVGTTTGKIMIRNILSTSTTPDFFTLLCSLDARYTYCGHEGPVKCIKAGPEHTFYSGGADGYICVWGITGDFGL